MSQHVDRLDIAQEGQLHDRPRVEVIPHYDRDLVAESRVHRGKAASPDRVVDRIIVDQRRHVDQLHHRRKANRVLGGLVPDPVRQQEDRRPKELPAQ